MTLETVDHHCPGCGTPQRGSARNPWYFCRDCLKLAVDGAGNSLEFANASLSGGLVWRRVGGEGWADAITAICRIKSRPVTVYEARFGGAIAEPLLAERLHDEKYITDLRKL